MTSRLGRTSLGIFLCLCANTAMAFDLQGHRGARGPAPNSLSFRELRGYDVGRVKPDSRYARRWSEQIAIDGTKIPSLAGVLRSLAALAMILSGSTSKPRSIRESRVKRPIPKASLARC